MPILKLAFVVVLALGVSACSTMGGLGKFNSEKFLSTPIQHTISDKVAYSHWKVAETARRNQNYQDAMDYYLQALDRMPNDPAILSRVAETHAQMNNQSLAEQAALQSNRTATDKGLLIRNWLIIRFVRQNEGNVYGVQEAERNLEQLI